MKPRAAPRPRLCKPWMEWNARRHGQRERGHLARCRALGVMKEAWSTAGRKECGNLEKTMETRKEVEVKWSVEIEEERVAGALCLSCRKC